MLAADDAFCGMCGISLCPPDDGSCLCDTCLTKYCKRCMVFDEIDRPDGSAPFGCYVCAKKDYIEWHGHILPKEQHHDYDPELEKQLEDDDPEKNWEA